MKYPTNQIVEKAVDILSLDLNGNDNCPGGVDKEIADINSYHPPKMLTIRQVAKMGILSETALRTMAKEGRLPGILVGNRLYINFDQLCTILNTSVAGCYYDGK